MLESVPPVMQGDPGDLSKPSRAHAMYAALENAMRILGEPYDYDFLMGVLGPGSRRPRSPATGRCPTWASNSYSHLPEK